MHQFIVHKIVDIHVAGVDISFTNASLFMVVVVGVVLVILLWGGAKKDVIPGRLQSLAEGAYESTVGMLRSSTGEAGMRFLPLVFSLFMFVLTANILGLVPYFFTVTAQIIVTAALAVMVITVVTIDGVYHHGFGFLKLFVPKGVPLLIAPLIAAIEVVSYLSRPVSLSVRLFANMLAGHITIKVFAGFMVSLTGLGAFGYVGALLSLVMVVALTALEFLVAALQAYVFAVLSCMYLNDALHPSH